MRKELTTSQIDRAKSNADAEIERIKDVCARKEPLTAQLDYLQTKIDSYQNGIEEIIQATSAELDAMREKAKEDEIYRELVEDVLQGKEKSYVLPLTGTRELIFDSNARFILVSESWKIALGGGEEDFAFSRGDFEEWLLHDAGGKLTASILSDFGRDPLKIIEYRRIWIKLLEYAELLRSEIPADSRQERDVTIAFLTTAGKFGESVRLLTPRFFEWSPDGTLDFKGSVADLRRIADRSGYSSWKEIITHITKKGKKIGYNTMKNIMPSESIITGLSLWPEISSILH